MCDPSTLAAIARTVYRVRLRPRRPIARGIAGPGLIAQIVVNKFGDHLPLYRQEDIFVRHGLHIAQEHVVRLGQVGRGTVVRSRSTTCNGNS